jgi:hypothetical protein
MRLTKALPLIPANQWSFALEVHVPCASSGTRSLEG